MKVLLMVMGIALASLTAFPTSASVTSTPMKVLFNFPEPPAWQSFMSQTQHEWLGPKAHVEWSDEVYLTLAATQEWVNDRVTYREDHSRDVWRVADRYGDCEDFALRYRLELMRQGFPPGALRLAMVLTPTGAGHAVLTVETTNGVWVVDSLMGGVRPWTEYPYTWLLREGEWGSWFIVKEEK